MGFRSTGHQTDPLADHAEGDPDLVGVAVRVWCTDAGTWVEVWQQGPAFPAGGTLVSSLRLARGSQLVPDPHAVAFYLAQCIAVKQQEGWPELR